MGIDAVGKDVGGGRLELNLLTETLGKLDEEGYVPEDVLTITNDYGKCISWYDFAKVADREYDEDDPNPHVMYIVIHLDDGGKLFRKTDNGSEWWEFIPRYESCDRLVGDDRIYDFVWDD